MEFAYPVARAAFTPFLKHGLKWTLEGTHLIPSSGPVILASNHVSYLDPLTLAWVANVRNRRIRFLAKAELFDKAGLGMLLREARQIPVERGTTDAQAALAAAVDAVVGGECVGVFPEGTISLDLDPMPGKSGAARLAAASGVPVLPVGLWGSHRILTKHREPEWQWGVPQVAVVGAPVRVRRDEQIPAATDRIMEAVCDTVRRAREIYPASRSERDAWWWRTPDSAQLRPARREADSEDDLQGVR